MKKNMHRAITLLVLLGLVPAVPAGAVPVEAYRCYITGLLAVRQGDAKTALQAYEKVMALDENATAIYRDLAYIYWQLGMTNEALFAAQKLGLAYPNDLSTQLFLGNFYLYAGQADRAREAWEQALRLDPSNESAMLYLAAFHSSGNAPEKAIAYWERYLKAEPDSAEAHYQLGLMLDKAGRLEPAKAAFQKAIALKPALGEAHIALGQLYEKDGQLLAAAEEYEQYVKLVPDNTAVLYYLGGLYYKAKNFGAAEDTFLRLRALNRDDTNALFWLGLIAEQKKEWPAAVRYLEEIRAREESPVILTRLSYYYAAQKDYCRAIKYLKKAARLDAQNPASYYLLGLAFMDAGKPRAAEKSLRQALKLKPDMEEVYFHLAMLHDQRGKFDTAVRELEKILALNPRHASALNYLGYSLADRGLRLKEAEEYVRRALAIDPGNGAYLDSLAWVHFRMGHPADAEKELSQALDIMSDPVIWEHLGDVRLSVHRPADAWDAYQRAQMLDPGNKKLLKKMRRTEKLLQPGTFERKLLKRAEGNLKQVSSLRLNFAVQGRARNTNFRLLGIFQYVRPELWRADILGNFMAPQVVVIQNGGIRISPQALSDTVSPESIELFDRVKDLLNARLLEQFDAAGVTVRSKGRRLIYTAGEATLIIDKDSATVREYRIAGRLILTFKSHVREEGLDLPAEIDMVSSREKITTNIKLHNYILNEKIDTGTFTLNQ
jgi:tetratricopeptide (TPR) repeat protein